MWPITIVVILYCFGHDRYLCVYIKNSSIDIPTVISGIRDGDKKLLSSQFLCLFFFVDNVAAVKPMRVEMVADRVDILRLVIMADNISVFLNKALNHMSEGL